MVKIPNIPPKEEIQYKEKQILLSLYEQITASSKLWFVFLGVVIVLTLPLKFILQENFTTRLVSSYKPAAVNQNPYTPQPLQITKVNAISVSPGIYSGLAQVVNPNGNISAREISYRFEFKNNRGEILETASITSYLMAAGSKFLFVPRVSLDRDPAAVELVLEKIRWTNRAPDTEVKFEILQKNSGLTPEDMFFVEGLVKNPQSFGLKVVDVSVVVFDKSNQNPVAVNSTILTDLLPFESRYFRVLWPTGRNINISKYREGLVEVRAEVNLLNPGIILDKGDKVPVR